VGKFVLSTRYASALRFLQRWFSSESHWPETSCHVRTFLAICQQSRVRGFHIAQTYEAPNLVQCSVLCRVALCSLSYGQRRRRTVELRAESSAARKSIVLSHWDYCCLITCTCAANRRVTVLVMAQPHLILHPPVAKPAATPWLPQLPVSDATLLERNPSHERRSSKVKEERFTPRDRQASRRLFETWTPQPTERER
jgi:hypothetical protein